MRIRPFFWFLLLASCASIVAFAFLYRPYAPLILQVDIVRTHIVANQPTGFDLQLTDSQGLPINQAQILPKAWMTNMVMEATDSQVTSLGNGRYHISIHLYMQGPWAVKIQTEATGFKSQQQTLFVQVT